MRTSTLFKIMGITLFIILITIGAYASYRAIDNTFRKYSSEAIESQVVRIAGNIISKQIEINNRAFKDELKNVSRAITSLVKDRDQRITDIGITVTKLKQTVNKIKESDHIYKKDSLADHEFIIIRNKDANGVEFPIAWAMYHPNKTENERWKTGTYPLELKSRIVMSENEDRSDSAVEVWFENNKMQETKGKKFPLNVSEVRWVRKELSDSFRFNPKLGLGFISGIGDIYPTLSLSAFTYGKSKTDITWKFLIASIGSNSEHVNLGFSPIEHNIGKYVPIIQNAFIGPYIFMNEYLEYNFGAGISLLF